MNSKGVMHDGNKAVLTDKDYWMFSKTCKFRGLDIFAAAV
jgi:hypothetical protein